MKEPGKNHLPVKAVLVTVVLTAVVMWGLFQLTGLRPKTAAGIREEQAAGHEEHQLWTCGMHPWIVVEEPGLCPICNMDLIPLRDSGAVQETSGGDRPIAYWRAPMNPAEIYDAPGKSAMGMDLVPVYEDEIIGGVNVSIDPVTRQNMGLRIAPVGFGTLSRNLRTYGHVTYDESRTTEISPKVDGWIETLHVNYAGESVLKGQPVMEIYSPRLVAAQEEYLTLFRSLKKGASSPARERELLASARQRLMFFDVAESEIDALEQSGRVSKNLTIRSPFSGVVVDKNAVEGGFFKAGTRLFTISDLSRVWVEAHIYEYELSRFALGQEATLELAYDGGRKYTGKVSFIYPYLQQKTRDVVVRIEFDNPDGELKPEMYGDVTIVLTKDAPGFFIPSQSVIRSGKRNIVFVAKGAGTFAPREVVLGMSLDGGMVEVQSGIGPSDQVVTSGQFLLDSESKLQEAVQKMIQAGKPGAGKPEKPGTDPNNKKGTAGDDDFFKDMES